jgi:hypothetical protein
MCLSVSYSKVVVDVEGMYFIVYLGLFNSAVSNWDCVTSKALLVINKL